MHQTVLWGSYTIFDQFSYKSTNINWFKHLILKNDDIKTDPIYIYINFNLLFATALEVKVLNRRAVGGILLGNAVVPVRDDLEKGAEFWILDLMDCWISLGGGEQHRFPLDFSISRRKYWPIKVHNIDSRALLWWNSCTDDNESYDFVFWIFVALSNLFKACFHFFFAYKKFSIVFLDYLILFCSLLDFSSLDRYYESSLLYQGFCKLSFQIPSFFLINCKL